MPTITRLDGWYDEEHDGVRPFRWIARDARCRVTEVGAGGPLYLQVVAAQPLGGDRSRLAVAVNGRAAGECLLGSHAALYTFPLHASARIDASGEFDLALSLDTAHRAPGDGRALGAIVYSLAIVDPRSLDEPIHGGGWYERDDDGYFVSRWMGVEAQVLVPSGFWRRGRFAALPVYTDMEYGDQVLTLQCGAHPIAELRLLHGWHVYDIGLPADLAGGEPETIVTLRLNRTQPAHLHPSDSRDLGVRVGALEVYDSARRYENTHELHDFCVSLATGACVSGEVDDGEDQAIRAVMDQNADLNEREFESGATVLTSFAPSLGIDLYGKCNIKPPCVYCQWDTSKTLEGEEVKDVVDERTLEEYGPFFRAARVLVNCSIGEPLLHPRLPQMLQTLARQGKRLEIVTNGQAFTPASVRALAGRDIAVLVSLDAASAATYARLRNDRWPEVLAGLIAFREAQVRAGGVPLLRIVFMPMRANLHDLEACFKLCNVVNAAILVLRPLLRFEHTDIAVDRGGYHFDYANEILTRAELEVVIERARELGRKYGVAIDNQFGIGRETAST